MMQWRIYDYGGVIQILWWVVLYTIERRYWIEENSRRLIYNMNSTVIPKIHRRIGIVRVQYLQSKSNRISVVCYVQTVSLIFQVVFSIIAFAVSQQNSNKTKQNKTKLFTLFIALFVIDCVGCRTVDVNNDERRLGTHIHWGIRKWENNHIFELFIGNLTLQWP